MDNEANERWSTQEEHLAEAESIMGLITQTTSGWRIRTLAEAVAGHLESAAKMADRRLGGGK